MRTLQDEIEILAMCEPIRDHQGGIWFGRNNNMADATFVDYGACRAFARAARDLPKIVAALEAVLADIRDYERVNNLAPNPGRTHCWDSAARAEALLATTHRAEQE